MSDRLLKLVIILTILSIATLLLFLNPVHMARGIFPGQDAAGSLFSGLVTVIYPQTAAQPNVTTVLGNPAADYNAHSPSVIFTEGLGLLKAGQGKNTRYGFVDRNGRWVIEPFFQEASSFFEGLAVARVGEKYGYIDKTGCFAIQPRFDRADDFHNGYAAVVLNGHNGFITTTGRYFCGDNSAFK